MSQLKQVVDPFGEVNVYPGSAGKTRVVATILMQPYKEGAQTGIALDGSGSMRKLYGLEGGGRPLSPIFGGPSKGTNEITPVAQRICAHLARHVDADGGTTCIYWAVGPGGSEIEVIGDFKAEEAERHTFGPPRDFGTGTQLLPALRYFVERFRTAPWGFYVFITDGELHDLEEVIAYSKKLALEIAARRRNPLKLVLIGVGPDVAEYQMQTLDDLETGTEVDLWDHKLASEMRVLEEIFAEVVDRNVRVASKGKILDPQGRVIKDYSDVGVPAFLEFEIGSEAKYFTLEVNGQKIHQSLVDGFSPPASTGVPAPQKQLSASVPSAPPPVSVPPPAPPPTPSKPEAPRLLDALPVDDPNDAAAEWKDLPLEFGPGGSTKDDDPGIDLERHHD